MHSGSCLTCIDMDGDNDKDIIVGDISCDSVEYFRNGGSPSNAHIDFATKVFLIQQTLFHSSSSHAPII